MKKGIVAALVILALIILISPGIVGRLAEKSVDEQLGWAADENEEIVIKSEKFDRGWFSSEGRHRIELGDSTAGARIRSQLGLESGEPTPALIIDTHIDHGLIAVSSMSRDNGSLAPGLGSAVSTVSVEATNGEVFEIPGAIYSSVGLGGELTSQYKLAAGSMGEASWGNADITATADARNKASQFDGTVDAFAFSQNGKNMSVADVKFEGDMNLSEYGYAIGDMQMSVGSINVASPDDVNVDIGPIAIDASSKLNGDRVDSDIKMELAMRDLAGVGDLSWSMALALENVDAKSMGAVIQAMDNMSETADPMQVFADVEGDLKELFAAGFELHLQQLDITLPAGTMKTRFNVDIPDSERDTFAWTSVLLSLEADADIEIPEALYDMAAMMSPGVGNAVSMGILKKSGDVYEMEAQYKKGLLTVNGAPLPIPLPGLQ